MKGKWWHYALTFLAGVLVCGAVALWLGRNSGADLNKQLADAKQQVQDIAVKAIEGASGARALSHINQIAMEQAKNRPQS